jgi:uncharacterized membrane protein YvbJ
MRAVNYCPDCGAAIPPDARFCPSCGRALAEKSTGTPPLPAEYRRRGNPLTEGMRLGTTGCVGCLTMLVLFIIVIYALSR